MQVEDRLRRRDLTALVPPRSGFDRVRDRLDAEQRAAAPVEARVVRELGQRKAGVAGVGRPVSGARPIMMM